MGNAIFRTENFYLPFKFGRKHITNIKLKAAILKNPFLSCSQAVIDNLSIKKILSIHNADIAVMYCIPYSYLSIRKKLSMIPGAIKYLGRPPYVHSFITFEDNFDTYCKQFKSNGYKLDRKVKRFKKNCRSTMRIKYYHRVDDVNEFLSFAHHISIKTYQHKLLRVGFRKTRSVCDYVRFMAIQGLLKSYILFDGNIPVAYLYASNINGRLIAHKTGYDPDYARLSPGSVLWYEVIKKLFQEKQVLLFDLSEGQARFKSYFGSCHLKCINIYYFRKTFFNLLVILFHNFYNAMHNLVFEIVDRLNLNYNIKKFFKVTIH